MINQSELNELMDKVIDQGQKDLKKLENDPSGLTDVSSTTASINHIEIDTQTSRISEDEPVEEEKKPHIARRIVGGFFDILFFGTILVIVFVMIMSVQSDNRYMDIFCYSPLYVETSSMESVIPRGSLIITKNVDPKSLQIGDDITFFDSEGTRDMVTHRIVRIIPNFERQGLAFEAKGVDNFRVDEHKVLADNVLGRVIIVMPTIGILFSYIKDNLLQVVILIVLARATIYMFNLYLKDFIADREKKLAEKKLLEQLKQDEILDAEILEEEILERQDGDSDAS